MTKLEIACVVCGLIGILIFQPTRMKIDNCNFADVLLIAMLIIKDLCFLAMIVLPLYFRLWRK